MSRSCARMIMLALGLMSLVSVVQAEQPQEVERIREIVLPAQQWRDGAKGVEYCEGVFRRYNGPVSEARCRVSVGGISGFIGTMRNSSPVPIADALVELSGLSPDRYSARVIRTHEGRERQLSVTYALVDRTVSEDVQEGPDVRSSKTPSDSPKPTSGWLIILSIVAIVGFVVLSLAYPIFGPVAGIGSFLIAIAGLAIAGSSDTAVITIIFFCIAFSGLTLGFWVWKDREDRAVNAANRAAWEAGLGTAGRPNFPQPVPDLTDVLDRARTEISETTPVILAQTSSTTVIPSEPEDTARARRRIVLD